MADISDTKRPPAFAIKTFVVIDFHHVEHKHNAARIVLDGTGALWLYSEHPAGDPDRFAALVAVYAIGKWISCEVQALTEAHHA